MILYSKNGDFLGIGKDELSFLGYEDLDEFKSIHNDVADLFVNKPGYIFKFKNFSWIDYALHSGAPKKSVIIKLKTGNEVEVAIKIKELFLYTPNENQDIYYCIECANNLTQTNQTHNESTFIQATPVTQMETPPEKEEDTNTFEEEKKSISMDDDFEKDIVEDVAVDFAPLKEVEEPQAKLKISDDVHEYQEETETKIESNIKFDEDFSEDIEEDIKKLKIDIIEDTEKEEQIEPNLDFTSDYIEEEKSIPTFTTQNDINLDLKTEETTLEELPLNDEHVEFDLLKSVDELGLDISLIGQLITDYMHNIDQVLPLIASSIENSDDTSLSTSIYELKGISDNLHMPQLSNGLKNILSALDKEAKEVELEKFKTIVTNFKKELL